MNLEHHDPELLEPNPWNTNVVSPENCEKLDASLERHGMVKPIIVRQIGERRQILGGQHRTESAIRLNMRSIPVLNLGEISDTRAKEIGLIDNARYGADDAMGLAELLEELGGAVKMGEFLPYSVDELAALGTEIDDDEIDNLLDDDRKEDEKELPTAKPMKTHQVMRQKVPVEDADAVADCLTEIMTEQGFTESDSLTNAGDALVFLVRAYREGSAC